MWSNCPGLLGMDSSSRARPADLRICMHVLIAGEGELDERMNELACLGFSWDRTV